MTSDLHATVIITRAALSGALALGWTIVVLAVRAADTSQTPP